MMYMLQLMDQLPGTAAAVDCSAVAEDLQVCASSLGRLSMRCTCIHAWGLFQVPKQFLTCSLDGAGI